MKWRMVVPVCLCESVLPPPPPAGDPPPSAHVARKCLQWRRMASNKKVIREVPLRRGS